MIETEIMTELAGSVSSVPLSEVFTIVSNTALTGVLIAGTCFLIGLAIKGVIKILHMA